MKLLKTIEKNYKNNIFRIYLPELEKYAVFSYLFCMLGVFPLYYKEQYYKIGDTKFEFFWNSSLCFIGISMLFALVKIMLQVRTKEKSGKTKWVENANPDSRQKADFLFQWLEKLSSLDYGVLVYGICVVLSYGFSNFKEDALKGAAGWEMGLCSQLIFVAVYFILSRQKLFGSFVSLRQEKDEIHKYSKQNAGKIHRKTVFVILAVHLISSALTFLLGILHRFEIDPLGMYVGLDLYQKIEFLSTIGQATWFSGYVCTVVAVGVILFYLSEQKWLRIIGGIYSVISFGILVIQNSDSAFMALAGILLLLGYFSLADMKKWCRFWQIMSLMWGTFAGIGILQKVFAYRAIPLDSLSVFFSQSVFTWGMFTVSVIIMFYCSNRDKKRMLEKQMQNLDEHADYFPNRNETEGDKFLAITKIIYKSLLLVLAAGILLMIIFIFLNTKGYLLQWFGYQSTHHYLLFDGHWGSNRGSTWMICWQSFMEMPFYQKLFGVGPDCLSAYLYSMQDQSDLLHSLWGNIRLTNAHNEYLNSLLCYGN